MCHMQYIRLKTISHKLEPAVRALATKGETRGKSRHDLDPSSNLGIPSSGSTLRVYEIWQIRQELSSKGLRISQYMALAELFDSCRPQFSQLLNWDNDTYPMASPWECQGGDHPCTNFFANNLERREGKKIQFSAEVSHHCCTSVFESWNQGCFPYVKISQRITPKLQTSLSVVNFLYMMLSGGIQRIGSMVCPPTWVRTKAQGNLSGDGPEEGVIDYWSNYLIGLALCRIPQ